MKFESRKKRKNAVRRRNSSAAPSAESGSPEKRRKSAKIVGKLLLVVFLGVFLFSCSKLIGIYKKYRIGADEYARLSDQVVAAPAIETEEQDDGLLNIDFDFLKRINQDLVCWIEIPDTGISYPVVQGVDNAYYLRRSFEGQDYFGGVIFMDYRCDGAFSSVNTILYGHHMLDGSMFAPLAKFLDKDYFEEHPRIYIYTEHSVLVYRIFAARQTDIADSCYTLFFDGETSAKNWIDSMAAFSRLEDEVEGDRILTLSTCTNVEKSDRYIVQGILEEVIAR